MALLTLGIPKPNASEFIDILAGRTRSRRVPLVEYIIDDVVMEPIATELLNRRWVPFSEDRVAYLDTMVEVWYRMGYDFVRYEESLPLPNRGNLIPDTARGSTKQRAWVDEHHGMIESWEDFERYPWPVVGDYDFSSYEYISSRLPEGMGLILSHGGGVFEHLSWIMSLEGLSVALHEDPALVKAVAARLGELMVDFYSQILDLENLVAVFPGDDMGYKSATLVSPAHLREYTLPWHRRFAAMAHERGVPYLLHSCGNVIPIMEDLIEDVRIDGKHSFEDAIMPVQDFQSRYGERIAVLGGLDLNILSGKSADEVRAHVRFLLETCGGKGRYAIGSGNSVPSYVPLENYLAMIEETHRFNGGL